MGDREYRDELLDASFEAVKLELDNTEKDVKRLQERADKLRAAAGALEELLPGDGQQAADKTPAFLRDSQDSDENRKRGNSPISEAARASA